MFAFNIKVTHANGESSEKTVTTRLPDPGSGWCKFLKVKTNDNTNNVTTTVKVYDVDDDAVYTKAAIAENAVTLDDTKTFPMSGDVKVGITPSGDPGVSGSTVEVRFSMVE